MGVRGWATRVNQPPPLQPDTGACCLSERVGSGQELRPQPGQGLRLRPTRRLVGPAQAQSCWPEAAPWRHLTLPKGSCRCQ